MLDNPKKTEQLLAALKATVPASLVELCNQLDCRIAPLIGGVLR
jgi:hypothetical protein